MKLLLPILTAILLCTTTLAESTPARRPNILFISIDDLNDWVGFLGGHPQAHTPNMDRLAKRGVVFANAHCAAPLCCPSRAAVYSGKQPFETGVITNDHHLRRLQPDLQLLPQLLSASGYYTLGTGKLMHRRHADLFDETHFPEQRWSPFTRGEANYTQEELKSKGTKNPRHVVAATEVRGQIVLPLNRMPSDRAPNQPKGESFDWGAFDLPDSAFGDGQITTWATAELDRSHEKPFFLAVGYYRPHIPLFAPAKYFQSRPIENILLPKTQDGDLSDLPPIGRKVATEAVTAGSHATVLRHDQWKEAVAAYLACTQFIDHQVGVLLDALDKSPHADNTIVVLWSDHGWHLGEKQHWGKWTGWERSTRVPLIVCSPKQATLGTAGATCNQPVSLLDLYPTLVDLCQIKPPTHKLSGESLVPLLRKPDTQTKRAVISTFGEKRMSIRDEQFRLVRYEDGTHELYDLKADPNEWTNIAATRKQIVERLQRALPAL